MTGRKKNQDSWPASKVSEELIKAADERLQKSLTDHEDQVKIHFGRYHTAAMNDGVPESVFESALGLVIEDGNWRELTEEEIQKARQKHTPPVPREADDITGDQEG